MVLGVHLSASIPSLYDARRHHATAVLGGTPGTSVDVQLLTLVAESPSRISHTLSVSQWSSSKVGAS